MPPWRAEQASKGKGHFVDSVTARSHLEAHLPKATTDVIVVHDSCMGQSFVREDRAVAQCCRHLGRPCAAGQKLKLRVTQGRIQRSGGKIIKRLFCQATRKALDRDARERTVYKAGEDSSRYHASSFC